MADVELMAIFNEAAHNARVFLNGLGIALLAFGLLVAYEHVMDYLSRKGVVR